MEVKTIKLDEKILVNVRPITYKHYKEKGYDVKIGQDILVSVDDLTDNSHAIEFRRCDNCNKVYSKQHRAHLDTYNSFGEDVCQECAQTEKYIKKVQEKMKETCLEKYGVEWYSQTQEHTDKVRETSLQRYGVEWFSQADEIKEKIIKTNLGLYGVENPSKLDFFKQKAIETNLLRYNVEWALQNDEIKERAKKTIMEQYEVENVSLSKEVQEKRKNTFLEKYGVVNPGQIPEVKEKILQAFCKNGTVKTSQQQIFIYETIKRLYPLNDVQINFPLSNAILDIVLKINDINIDIEYDGWYWHQNKKGSDYARDVFVKSQGYKVMRIRGGEMLPTEEQLIEAINKLVNQKERSFIEIKLDDWKETD